MRSRVLSLSAGILTLAAVTRLPGVVRPWFDRDEAEIAVEAQALLRGDHLYRDVLDRKPPLAPAVFAAAQWAVGPDLRPVRAILILCVALTALTVVGIVRRLDASDRAAAVAGVLYVLGVVAFVPRDGQAANFELWAALPAAGAVYAAVRADPDRPGAWFAAWFALAGTLVGVAACVKQPFATTLAPVLAAAVSHSRRARALTATLLGAIGSFVLVGSRFGIGGMLRWAWAENGDYLRGSAQLAPVLAVAALATGFAAVTHLPTVWLATVGAAQRGRAQLLILVWLAASAVGVAAALRFTGHYFHLLVAPLCVLAGLGADRVSARTLRIAVGASAAIAAVAVLAAFVRPLAPMPMRIGAVLRAVSEHSRPSERILVWGSAPEIAWKSGRAIAGGYVHSGWLTSMWRDTHDAPTPVSVAIAEDPALARRWAAYLDDISCDSPRLVIDTSTRRVAGFDRYPMDSTPLGPYVRRHYRMLGTEGGMRIWRRIGPDRSRC